MGTSALESGAHSQKTHRDILSEMRKMPLCKIGHKLYSNGLGSPVIKSLLFSTFSTSMFNLYFTLWMAPRKSVTLKGHLHKIYEMK